MTHRNELFAYRNSTINTHYTRTPVRTRYIDIAGIPEQEVIDVIKSLDDRKGKEISECWDTQVYRTGIFPDTFVVVRSDFDGTEKAYDFMRILIKKLITTGYFFEIMQGLQKLRFSVFENAGFSAHKVDDILNMKIPKPSYD